ncbi:unnamed protein product [Staurois parvus]|uniref:Uncharacterized protein n=1 Tax=Staurois parvus TaxID=386267 RepID=A0ABN9H8N2_9NEOB|nr:unnamed protein product [Staurois parvus]
MKEKYDLPEDLHSDSINKKLNDLQQEKQELENRVKSLTLDKDRAAEEMKKIIQRELNFNGQGKEIGERENVLQQQETQRKEIGLDILSQEGGEGAHGHETLLRSQETFPDKGNHLQKTAGSSCLKDMNMDELITVIKKIINEKDLTIERQREEIKKYEILGKRTCQKN